MSNNIFIIYNKIQFKYMNIDRKELDFLLMPSRGFILFYPKSIYIIFYGFSVIEIFRPSNNLLCHMHK